MKYGEFNSFSPWCSICTCCIETARPAGTWTRGLLIQRGRRPPRRRRRCRPDHKLTFEGLWENIWSTWGGHYLQSNFVSYPLVRPEADGVGQTVTLKNIIEYLICPFFLFNYFICSSKKYLKSHLPFRQVNFELCVEPKL